MATGRDSNCPICQDIWDDVASALPCCHQFCLGCILRWTTINPSCPLCRTAIETVRFSERGEEDYVQFVITSPAEPAETSGQPGTAPDDLDENGPHGPEVSPAPSPQGMLSPAEQRPLGPVSVGGLLPEVWAGIFRKQRRVLELLRPWLRRRLQRIFRHRWWQAEIAESSILRELCLHGPDPSILALRLQTCLKAHASLLVRELVNVIAVLCSKEAKRQLGSHDPREDNSASSSSSSSRETALASVLAGSSVQEGAGTSQAGLQRGRSGSRPVPNPAEREQPRRSRRGTGPCAQGSIHSSSSAGQGRDPPTF